jgi:UDP-N-acetylmuramate dehydrogenase
MTRSDFAERWAAALGPDRWHSDVPLAPLTTFHVGGAAEWLADVTSEDELRTLVVDANAAGVGVTMLGGGSNVLVADAGVSGVVVRLRLTEIDQLDASTVRAGAGVTMNGLVRWTVGRGLAGFEAWAGTPGTVGGAVYGNAHWAGENIGDHVREVRLVSRDGLMADVPAADMEFGYDTSRIQRTRELVVWASFNVGRGEVAALRERARASLHYRKATQPLALPSAGCIFQNPPATDRMPEGVPRSAGALVDRAGLKGVAEGGARISDRHANFIVNDGGATAEDIRALIERARAAVHERFGVELRDEIVYLGTFRHG